MTDRMDEAMVAGVLSHYLCFGPVASKERMASDLRTKDMGCQMKYVEYVHAYLLSASSPQYSCL